jgi:predicted MFS family arabinose efflux permease
MRRVLAHRDFRLLWLSQVGSAIGDRLVLVVLALYVNKIGTPSDVGLVLAAQSIPFVALLLIGGVWADRLPRHRVMVVTDVARASLHAVLAVLILAGSVEIWQIVVIEALFGAAHAFFRPAYSGLVPQTVPEEHLQEANAVNMMSHNVSSFAGPAVGTALFVAVGAGAAIAIDAATFLASAVLLAFVHPRERGPRAERAPMVTELAQGWHEVRSRTWVWIVLIVAGLGMLAAWGPYQSLGPSLSQSLYGDAAVFGIASTALGVGSLFGSALALRWRPQHPLQVAMTLNVWWAINYVVFGLGPPVALMLASFAISGASIALFVTWWEVELARHIQPAALSRVSSWDWMVSLGLSPVGLLLAGPIAAAVGARETQLVGAGLALAVALVGTVVIRRHPVKSGTPLAGVEASA